MSRCLPVLLLFCLLLPGPGAVAEEGAPPLGAAQRDWLRAHSQWRVGVVMQAPYAQLDRRQHKLYGANVDVMTRLATLLGVELRWRQFQSQESLEQALRNGQIDLAPGLVQTPAGLRLWLYSDPYMRVSHLLVGERVVNGSVDLERLGGGSSLALKASGSVYQYLRSSYPNLDVQPVNTARQALQRVLGQQASYAVLDEAQLGRLAREAEFASLAIVGDIGFPQLLRVASRRDWPELAAIVETGLRAIPAKELDALHSRWLPPIDGAPQDVSTFLRLLCVLLGVLLAIVLLLLFWVRRQRDALDLRLLAAHREIELREVARDALRLAQFSIDHSTVGILWVNWDSHVRYANRAAEQMLGYSPDEVVGRPLGDFEPTLDMDRWLVLWRQARQGGAPLSFESECRRADGSGLPVELSLSFMRYQDTEYLVAFITDITERRRALAALRESEARLQGIAANVPGLVFRLERARVGEPVEFAFISEGSESLVGYPAAALLSPGRGIRGLVHPDDLDGYRLSQDRAVAGDSDWRWQGRILTRDGEHRWADIKAIARRLEGGKVVWDGIVWDISENKRTELALAESQGRLRELSAHLESVREEEKARIAREVHDELGQVLTVLKLETSMCELSYAELDAGLRERLGNMKRLIAQLFQLVRDVATALRPPILDAGIASAMEWQAQRFEARTQIPCLVEVPEHLPPLADATAIGLFRILQEALTNIIRHAEAQAVELRLTLEDDTLCLSIADDGRGFHVSGARPNSFGLVGMGERVLMLGGCLEIDSQPGEGTRLEVRVPLADKRTLIARGVQT